MLTLRWIGIIFAILTVSALVVAFDVTRHQVATNSVLKAPLQTVLPAGQNVHFEKDGWTLQPLAAFKVRARVLGVKKYSAGDTGQLAPYDLALGWGVMAEDAVLQRIEITQNKRFYTWRYWGQAPLSETDIIGFSTNAHIIPADESVLQTLQKVNIGDRVELEGYLVQATHPRADKPWRSSLVRDDRGEGACEIIYAKALQHISGRSGNL